MASNANLYYDTVKWSRNELNAFIKLMIDNVKNGNKTNATFNKAGWTNIKNRLEATMGRTFSKEQLRNKMNKLRIDYYGFKKLLETEGFGWNSITRTATVHDETVWERAILANPTWSKFRKNGLPYWPELQMIFGESCARGDGGDSQALEIPVNDGQNEIDIDVDLPTPTTSMDKDLDDIEDFEVEEEHPSVIRRLDRAPSAQKKRRLATDFSDTLQSIEKYFAWRMDRMGNASSTSIAPTPPPPSVTVDNSIATCHSLLDTIPDLTKELYMKAVNRMWEDPKWRQSFVVSIPKRRVWLLEMLEK